MLRRDLNIGRVIVKEMEEEEEAEDAPMISNTDEEKKGYEVTDVSYAKN